MADFERSSQSSHRGYKPHGNRTSDWVSRLPPKHAAHFLDPTMPPSDTESAIYSSDSDGESTHSVPPRFVLRFPDGREERVSDRYPGPNASARDVRSRATSGPVNYGPSHHHHSRSVSMHPSGGHPGVPFRPHSSNSNVRHQEQIRILPPQRSMTPATAGYINSRPVPVHHPRSSPVAAPSPRRAYERGSPNSSDHSEEWVTRYGPPEAIKFSNSHPSSKYDPPTRDYSASGYRPHPSSRLRGQSVVGSPSSHMTLLTKENTIANSHSRALSRGVIEDNWSVIDEDEEWEKEQQRAAHRRGRASSQSSGSPPLTYSRSRTTSSSSRSGFYPPGPKHLGPEKMGPPPANSTGAGSMKRPFFSRWFRSGHDKSVPAPSPQPHNRLRRHSISGSRR